MDTPADIIRALTFDDPGRRGSSRVLDLVIASDGVAYAAVERVDGPRFPEVEAHGPAYVTAAVVICRPEEPWPYSMVIQHEWQGPRDSRCPARILDQLSPIEAIAGPTATRLPGPWEWASTWRERCRAALVPETADPSVAV